MCRRAWMLFSSLALITVFGCGDKSAQLTPPNKDQEVEVSKPIKDTLTNYEFFQGRTQAINSVDLRSRVTGYLAEAPFKEGEDVKKNEVLFVIQQKPFRDALRQATANRDQQKAQLTYNEATYKRNSELSQKGGGVVSADEVQQTRSARDASKAAVEAAEAAIEIAKQNLDWTEIRAPFDGRVSRRLVDPGNDILTDNTILATLVQLDPLYAYFDVDERTLLQIGNQLPQGKVPANAAQLFPVTLGLANEKLENFSHPGVLKFSDNRVDATTGTLRMWGIFENPKFDLKPGLFIRVRMGIGKPQESWFVAESALGSDQGRQYLYLVNKEQKDDGSTKDVIAYFPVEVGQRKNGLIAVKGVNRDLKPDDRIVVKGLQTIRPKIAVETKSVDMPRANGSSTNTPVVGTISSGEKGLVPAKPSGGS
jgi:RND family efflux transporter MFP subunit